MTDYYNTNEKDHGKVTKGTVKCGGLGHGLIRLVELALNCSHGKSMPHLTGSNDMSQASQQPARLKYSRCIYLPV